MIDWQPNGLVAHSLPRPFGLIEADVIVDVGCGVRPVQWYKPREHVCVEPHLPYLERVAAARLGYQCLNLSAIDGLDYMMGRKTPGLSYSIYLLDVIEHMSRDDGAEAIRLALEFAPLQLVVYTPHGFMHQDGPDPWGLGGDEWQVHRSGWTPDDFPDWKTQPYGRGFFATWTAPTVSSRSPGTPTPSPA